ncbi:Agc/pkg protein kinase, partial [Globisporangium splendens]
MGNCCSTESTNPTAHARRSTGGGANAANANGVSAVPLQNGSGPEILKPAVEAQDKQPQTNGVENGGGPVVKEAPVEPSIAKQLQHEPQMQEPPRSQQSKKSVASGRTQPEGPGPTHSLQIGDYNLRYSYYSKRGYYPEARKKANQDSYYCETHFAGDDQKAFFAVFDGHGQYGDVCSQFSAEYLPEFIVSHLENNVGILPALTRAHLETNQTMHEASFDDSMSGTTSISVLFHGNEIHIANVGDSRAIIAQENLKAIGPYDDMSLVAKPLSIDQTPFRKDERERVKKCGARILTVDQVEGFEPIHENWGLNLGDEIDENGDPPRIWHPYGQYPGTAFTRSIGDLVSEELGVTAEPEILCKTLNSHDKFIVIASDGVFEFLTSQNVVDIVKKFDDPSEACRALVEEAYNRWLQFEVRTDDITAICIYLDGISTVRDLARGSIYVGAEVLDLQSMQRPVRGTGKKDYGQRNTIVGTEAIRLSLTEGLFDGEDPGALYDLSDDDGGEKSDSEIKWIKEIVQGNFLFNHLSEEKILEVISVLKRVDVNAGDIVIRQGASGDTFYLIDHGEFEVRVLPDAESSQTEKDGASLEEFGEVVHVYKSGPNLHPTFGELALIYSKPRAATVIAKEKGALWALDRLAFRAILMRGRPMRDVVHRLRQISLLRPLTVAQTNLVAEEMKVMTFEEGQFILHEGMNEPGFFLITSGKVESTSKQNNIPTLQLKALDYFGEVALVRRRSISQRTIRVLEQTECLFITKETFEQSVGKLSSILEKDKIRRFRKERISESRKNAKGDSFVLFDEPDEHAGVPTTVDQLEIVGNVFSDAINTIRLVMVKGSSPPAFMTLRSVSKQAIYDASMQKHVSGERDIYVSLYEKNALVPNVCGMNTNDTDIHLLYNTQVVGSLESFLTGEGKGESFVRYYAAQVVLALEFLHSEGIVSRTADPTNLMVDRNGNIRMLNLRLSKYVGRGRTYTVCGTPEYLSPEQIKGEGHNIAADYWSLGVLMYELLCGHTPFSLEKKDDIEILNQITSFRPEQLTWPENASAEIKDIIQKLLSPELTVRLGFKDVKANYSQNVCEGIKRHPFFAGTSWEATKIGSFAAPLEAEAAAQFKQITASGAAQELNIGSEYTGDFQWLTGF